MNDAVTAADPQYELDEALSEIRRHHADFERIRSILDAYEKASRSAPFALWELTHAIRQVVG